MKCAYCGNVELPEKSKSCNRCGAPVEVKADQVERHEPFLYNGYMVWPCRDYAYDRLIFYFWLGDRLVDTIEISQELWHSTFSDCGVDHFDFIWNLFRLSQGEDEVFKYKEQNKRYPASFEIRYIPNPEREEFRKKYEEVMYAHS